MWSKKPPADAGPVKEEPRLGTVGKDGELVRDAPKKTEPEVKVVHADEAGKVAEGAKAPTLEERLAGLEDEVRASKAREAEANRRAEEAEARATKASGTADANQDAAFRNHKTAVANAATAVKSELATAKQALAKALETGDFNGAADAQEAIAEAKAKELGIQAEQSRIDAWEKLPPEQRRPPPKADEVRQPQTPREAVNVRGMPKAARDYLDEHPEYLDDWKLWNKLTRAHQDATEVEGHEPYGDDYFAFVDQRMGAGSARRQPPRGDGALPPSRSGPAATGTRNSSEVALTPRQREAAHFSFPELPPDQAEIEYAKNLVALERDGRMTRH